MNAVLFDDSLEVIARLILTQLGPEALINGVILRDAAGLLSFVSAGPPPPEGRRLEISELLKQRLGAYARPDWVIRFAGDPGVGRLLSDPNSLFISGRALLSRDRSQNSWLGLARGPCINR
jgi:hypothetical protein